MFRSRRVDEVVAADSREIAIPGEDHHLQLRRASLSPVANGIVRPWVAWKASRFM